MRGRGIALLAASFLLAALAGCGSNMDSDREISTTPALGADPATGVAYAGAAACIGCHEGFSWSSKIVQNYLAGKHVVHSDHITAASDAACLECHAPVGDSKGLEGLIDAANVPAEGLAAVTCEACHGAGGEHYGVGPMPVAKPGIDECGKCHDALPESHLTFHPEANNIKTNFKASRHYTASVRNEAICSRCHTDEGGKLYKDVTTREQLLATVLPVGSDEPVQCRTCHDPHKAGGLLFEEVESRGRVVASAEYATCVSCHMGDNAAVVASAETDEDGNLLPDLDATELIYHETVYYRVITDTHYDDPATLDVIEGYVVDPTNEKACLVCHDVHAVKEIRADDDSSSFSNTVNDQWSKSAHGGFIGDIKLAVAEDYDENLDKNRTIEQMIAIKEAGSTDDDAPGWVHYPWTDISRASCVKCHTATGFVAYSKHVAGGGTPATFNSATLYDENGKFPYIAKEVDGEGNIIALQKELLYCWGCHSDNAGGLNNPGAITADYSDAPFTYPDVNGSNVCMSCHTGRESGDSIKAAAEAGDDFTNKSFTNSHYLAAGGIVFAATGYEYDVDGDETTDDYANVPYYAHDQIGLGEGENGPCVGCHMTSEQNEHGFLPIEEDEATDAITAITSTVCVECHDGEHGPAFVAKGGDEAAVAEAADFLTAEAEEFEAALGALEEALQASGIFFAPSYPYFFNDTNGNGVLEESEATRANGVRNWGTPETMGAAFNFNLLEHDPGCWAHNRFYTKRLIFDSIDWLDNNTFDGTITLADAAAADYLDSDADTAGVQRP